MNGRAAWGPTLYKIVRRLTDRITPSRAAKFAALILGEGSEWRVLLHARVLRKVGLQVEALELLERNIDPATASTRGITALAIQAKINGRFDRAARLFALSYSKSPRSFLLREFADVLPETNSPGSIIEEFSNSHELTIVGRAAGGARSAASHDSGRPVIDEEELHDLFAPDLLESGHSARARRAHAQRRINHTEIRIIELGWGHVQRPQGQLRRLRQIDFVRADVVSDEPLVSLQARLDGRTVGETDGVPVLGDNLAPRLTRRIFNCWFDLSGVTRGPHELVLHFEKPGGGYRRHRERVFVDPDATHETGSAASVHLPVDTDRLSLDARIRTLPSVAFEARRTPLTGPFQKILVIRADQLGDMCQSLNAISMLRAALPDARLDALVAPSNVELVRGLGIFEDIHTVQLTHDPSAQRRYASLDEQKRLRDLLACKTYDLAVDLSPGFETQNLMLLANARNTAGFKPQHFKWMTFGADIHTHDPINQREAAPHSAMIDSFMASLIAMIRYKPLVLPRPDMDWELLQEFGIDAGERYVVLHGGARLELVRWPLENFVELANALTQAGIRTVLLVDDAEALSQVDLTGSAGGLLYASAKKLPFTTLDSLLSHCSAFVGNDTGPKHLAALRGAPVISMHTGRHNWSEWGQDAGGVIVARRVPCVGCGIEDPQLCGKGLACLVDIKPGEILEQVRKVLARADGGSMGEP